MVYIFRFKVTKLELYINLDIQSSSKNVSYLLYLYTLWYNIFYYDIKNSTLIHTAVKHVQRNFTSYLIKNLMESPPKGRDYKFSSYVSLQPSVYVLAGYVLAAKFCSACLKEKLLTHKTDPSNQEKLFQNFITG